MSALTRDSNTLLIDFIHVLNPLPDAVLRKSFQIPEPARFCINSLFKPEECTQNSEPQTIWTTEWAETPYMKFFAESSLTLVHLVFCNSKKCTSYLKGFNATRKGASVECFAALAPTSLLPPSSFGFVNSDGSRSLYTYSSSQINKSNWRIFFSKISVFFACTHKRYKNT